MSKLRLVSFGLGPIGLAVADLALRKKNFELVGAIDTDPEKVGKSLASLIEDAAPAAGAVTVEADAEAAYARLRPDAIFHCTSSFLPVISDQLCTAARAGVNVVSSAEELLVPDLQHPELAATVDAAAREGGATVVGTGVNPGYVLDYLAIVGSAVCHDVQRVRGVRVVDAGTRRLPLQRKVGASLTAEQFAEQERTGRFGHIGMRESVALVARALGIGVDAIEQTLAPLIAERRHQTPFLTVEAGQVAGIHNVGLGKRGGETVIELDLKMYVGAEDPRDEVFLDGSPDLHLRFEGGIPGDQATAAMLVNTVRQVVEAPAGLRTIADLPPPRIAR